MPKTSRSEAKKTAGGHLDFKRCSGIELQECVSIPATGKHSGKTFVLLLIIKLLSVKLYSIKIKGRSV